MVTLPASTYITIPAPLRRRCGLETSDQVLLAALPDQNTLAAYSLTALAQAILRDSDSPYTPEDLLSALDQVIAQLTYAIRDALSPIQPPPPSPGARSKENPRHPTDAGGARSEENSGATWH